MSVHGLGPARLPKQVVAECLFLLGLWPNVRSGVCEARNLRLVTSRRPRAAGKSFFLRRVAYDASLMALFIVNDRTMSAW